MIINSLPMSADGMFQECSKKMGLLQIICNIHAVNVQSKGTFEAPYRGDFGVNGASVPRMFQGKIALQRYEYQ